MAPPIYFFPKLTREELAPEGKLSPAVLSQYGDLARTFADLTDLRRDASLTELTGHGPGGSSGCLLCALPAEGQPPPRLGYFPDFQTWTPVGGTGSASGTGGTGSASGTRENLWVGTDNEHPIAPADLRRKKTFPGYEIELAGGQWTVPVVRNPEGGTGLPRDFVYADGGKVEQRIKAAYIGLWEKFARAVWLLFDPEGPWPLAIDLAEGTDLCLEALALNYRVGRIEQNLLGLIDSETWLTILAASVDYPTFRDAAEAVEREKKTRRVALAQPVAHVAPAQPAAREDRSTISREIAPQPESTDSSPGPGADCPGTDPAGEN